MIGLLQSSYSSIEVTLYFRLMSLGYERGLIYFKLLYGQKD